MRKSVAYSLDETLIDKIIMKCPVDVPISRFVERVLKKGLGLN